MPSSEVLPVMTYEIWSRASGNRIGVFDSEAEALELVRDIAGSAGTAEGEDLILDEEDDAGRSLRVVRGPELVALAQHRWKL